MVKDKSSSTFLCQGDATYWQNRDMCVNFNYNTQTLSPDMLYAMRLEPRVKWGRYPRSGPNSRKRLKTAGGIIKARVGTKGHPFKGNTAGGIRAEQKVRLDSRWRLVGDACHVKAKMGQMSERGRGRSLELQYKPKLSSTQWLLAWNGMRVRSHSRSRSRLLSVDGLPGLEGSVCPQVLS